MSTARSCKACAVWLLASQVCCEATAIDLAMEQTRPRLSWISKLSFSSGHFLNVLGWAMWSTYAITFFTKVLGLPHSIAGDIFQAAQICGAVSIPLLGLWSDRTRIRYGRRKIFLLAGVIAIACSFFFLWYECIHCSGASPKYQAVYFAFFGVVFVVGWAAIGLPQLALIPELAPDTHTIVQLNALRNVFTYLASIIVLAFFWALLKHMHHGGSVTSVGPADKQIFWIMAIVVIVLGVAVSTPFHIFVRERPDASSQTLRWYKWLLKPQFYLTAILFATARSIFLVPQTFMPFFFIDTLNMDKTSIAKGPIILLVTSFIATLLLTMKCSRKVFGEKMIYFLGIATIWAALIWFWVQDGTDDSVSSFNLSRDSVYGATVLLGIGGATILTISMTMISYLIGDNTGSSAFVCSWMAFSDLFTFGVIVGVIQNATPDSPERWADFYRTVIVSTPFAASAVGVLTIVSFELLERYQCRRGACAGQQGSHCSPSYQPVEDVA